MARQATSMKQTRTRYSQAYKDEALDEMQTDLDDYLVTYNTKRPHQSRNMKGMTPYAVFKNGLPKTPKKESRKTAENTA